MTDYSKIPESTISALKAWIKYARPMGSFCEAVVSNDLREALGRADDDTRAAIFETVAWMYNHAPIDCWGSAEALTSWPKAVRGCKGEDCDELGRYQCDGCDTWFCEDHGQKGGDRQVQDVGAVAYPALCDKCREVRP